ncbi:hypothetical protein E5Q_00805 [Mixia osmundae IAM 14324]|uniref:Uncharacterized protein n=1 Tax=Mixia osmundae (strain CBS 9802 / IAM 14324 / JCM 22182 / KY 12970) TaxID=764103 RepID=G7DU97_MIXOS|nr:hypothetical protein E5Q_00805 [Mixia osmundae IAM 14324]
MIEQIPTLSKEYDVELATPGSEKDAKFDTLTSSLDQEKLNAKVDDSPNLVSAADDDIDPETGIKRYTGPRVAPRHRFLAAWQRYFGFASTYRRQWLFCVATNLALLCVAATEKWHWAHENSQIITLINIVICVLGRNELFLKLLLDFYMLAFARFPLSWRVLLCKHVQGFGGIHSGTAVSSFMWLIFLLVHVFQSRQYLPAVVLTFAVLVSVCIALSMLVALPPVRYFYHDYFEAGHRFIGWTSLAFIWVLCITLSFWDVPTQSWIAKASRLHNALLALTVVLTALIVAPWLSLRKVAVEVETPSDKLAILKFPGGLGDGFAGRISRSPLMETHAFGITSEGPDADCHYMGCGVQGDFTKGLVSNPPKYLWTRKIRFAAASYPASMFKRGVVIATGAGIGAVLATALQNERWFLIWVASDLEKTFGTTFLDMIERKIPEERRIIWDTRKKERPHTMKLLEEVVEMWQAEVVFITSNPKGNKDIKEGCYARGIYAFGPRQERVKMPDMTQAALSQLPTAFLSPSSRTRSFVDSQSSIAYDKSSADDDAISAADSQTHTLATSTMTPKSAHGLPQQAKVRASGSADLPNYPEIYYPGRSDAKGKASVSARILGDGNGGVLRPRSTAGYTYTEQGVNGAKKSLKKRRKARGDVHQTTGLVVDEDGHLHDPEYVHFRTATPVHVQQQQHMQAQKRRESQSSVSSESTTSSIEATGHYSGKNATAPRDPFMGSLKPSSNYRYDTPSRTSVNRPSADSARNDALLSPTHDTSMLQPRRVSADFAGSSSRTPIVGSTANGTSVRNKLRSRAAPHHIDTERTTLASHRTNVTSPLQDEPGFARAADETYNPYTFVPSTAIGRSSRFKDMPPPQPRKTARPMSQAALQIPTQDDGLAASAAPMAKSYMEVLPDPAAPFAPPKVPFAQPLASPMADTVSDASGRKKRRRPRTVGGESAMSTSTVPEELPPPRLQTTYLPSADNPERHRGASHLKTGRATTDDAIGAGCYSVKRAWRGFMLDIKFSWFRYCRDVKRSMG